MATVRKLKVHIADELGGMRVIRTTTENEVLLVLDFENGDRVRFRAVLSKYEPKGDNQGTVTASVEWVLGSPDVLKHGNGPQRPQNP